jgi:uncharacterized protein (DUF488 family)
MAAGPSETSATIWTVGHSTRGPAEFAALLHGHDITRLVDVRTMPRSRRHPHFDRERLAGVLAGLGIGYTHIGELGGLRKPRADSVNGAWRNASFRGYADHMQTPAFAAALSGLVQWAAPERVAIMCAEAVPWRCHRSLLADALTARGWLVLHITAPHRAEAHALTPFARVEDGRVVYPPVQAALTLIAPDRRVDEPASGA